MSSSRIQKHRLQATENALAAVSRRQRRDFEQVVLAVVGARTQRALFLTSHGYPQSVVTKKEELSEPIAEEAKVQNLDSSDDDSDADMVSFLRGWGECYCTVRDTGTQHYSALTRYSHNAR